MERENGRNGRERDGAALEESERKYRLLFNAAPDPIWVMDPVTDRILEVNEAAVRRYGYSREEFLSLTVRDIRPPEDVDRLREAKRLYRQGKHLGGPWRHSTKDGTVLWVELSWHKFEFQGREARLVIVRDVTERKRAEDEVRLQTERLNASEERYRIVSEMMSDFAYAFRVAPDGSNTIEWVTGPLSPMTGQAFEEFLEHGGWRKGVHPDDLPVVDDIYPKLLAGEETRAVYRVRTNTGEERWIETHSRPVWDAEEGRVTRLFGAARDITERKQAEAALVERENLLQLMIDTEPACVKLLDREGRVLRMNRAGLAILEAEAAEQVVGECVYPFVTPEHREAFRRLNEGVFGGESGTLTFEIVGRKGTRRWMETHAVPLRNQDDEVLAALSITRDITEQRRLGEELRQAQKMEAVGRLAGGIAHDFNNLLTVINGYGELMLSDLRPDHPLRPALEEIHRAGERAAELTRRLLAFSRKQMLQPKVLDLNQVVADTEQMLRRLIGEDIAIEMRLDPEIGRVKVDPGQLSQVIVNLAVNARDAMPEGGRLTLETGNAFLNSAYTRENPGVAPGAYARLTIRDTGTGMGPEVLDHIFEPFFTTKGPGKGTGLGLPMVYGTIKQSGGHIEVETAPGRGTTFHIYLPLHREASAAGAPEDGSSDLPRGAETVLVVEDEEGVRDFARRVLERCGYRVLEAASGAEALGIAAGHPGTIDLLATDVVMPGANGRVLAEQLSGVRPDLKVLYISGYADEEVLRRGVAEAGAAFLPKPFTPAALASKVREVLDGRPVPAG
jgi:PAS domain S-box-containing protein